MASNQKTHESTDSVPASRRVVAFRVLCSLLVLAVLAAGGCTPKADQPAAKSDTREEPVDVLASSAQDLGHGLYAAQCAACHGASGMGDGPAAYLLYPKPRDFTSGLFRFKSTMGNQPPTDADLKRIVHNGIPGTAMPAFASVLTEKQIDSLVPVVQRFMPEAQRSAVGLAIDIPAPPTFSPELVTQGRLVYSAMGCALCHGDGGQGDGPSAKTLRDSTGVSIPPADFTYGVFKSGPTPHDLYRTIMVGVAGTPMPAHLALKDQFAAVPGVKPETDAPWALVAYLKSLESHSQVAAIGSGATFRAQRLPDQDMASQPLHPAWKKITPVVASIQPLWQRKTETRYVEVQAGRTDKDLVVRLRWPDTTVDTAGNQVDLFSDAAGIMFGRTQNIPALAMGSEARRLIGASAVYIWQWKAVRQTNDDGQLHDAASRDEAAADMYPFKKGDPVKGPITEHDATFITAWRAGNSTIDPALVHRSALESNAIGFGSRTIQTPESQNLRAFAQWSEGNWVVVLVRALDTKDRDDVMFRGQSKIPLAFAVWDGHAGDRNGTKLVSGWHWLEVGD